MRSKFQRDVSTAKRDVLDLLGTSDIPLSPSEVARILGKSSGTIRQMMWQMRGRGELHARDGRYSTRFIDPPRRRILPPEAPAAEGDGQPEEQMDEAPEVFNRKEVSCGLRFDILKRDAFRCRLCGRMAADRAVLEIDHIIPVVKGGKSTPDNLWTLCRACNRGKAIKGL